MFSNGVLVLLWLAFVHIAGIYLFTSGFLLTRLALTETSSGGTLAPTHSRAVLLIIDSLRFDFVTSDPPLPVSPYHHNVLSLPAQLTAQYPKNSFIFNSYADPPTTTLQRIKGITTGSLPTFVDLGNNFGGSSIEEDSIVKQLRNAGKTCAFMGDDTWMSVFPDSFHPNMTFPYDSFNVEDLHTVDNGVITHLFPLLEDKSKPFNFLVGHFLGVDHVGHRVGPDHPSMKAKLEQMNDVLTRVVELLDDDTLLVVLGDHGMDSSGDHGGDGTLETSAALWIYSKSRPLRSASDVPSGLVQYATFPGTVVPHRRVEQIDLVPTLSLLLGLPIPFNNLGSVIPELFGTDLPRALSLNSAQIHTYLQAYRDSPSGGELDDAWEYLRSAWSTIKSEARKPSEQDLIYHTNYTRVALAACRAMWAQFNPVMMGLGLLLLFVGLASSWGVYNRLCNGDFRWEAWIGNKLSLCLRGIATGAVLGFLGYLVMKEKLQPNGIDALDCVLFAAPFASCVVFWFAVPPQPPITNPIKSVSFITLTLHTISFFSNSFTFWEDRIVPYLLLTNALLPAILTGVRAPTARLRRRILGFSVLFALCVRAMSYYTVCREEQQPYCHVTFYSSLTVPAAPFHVLFAVLPVMLGLVYAMGKLFLGTSRSNGGLAKIWLSGVLMPALLMGSLGWILEWADTTGVLAESAGDMAGLLRTARTWLARVAYGLVLVVGGILWWNVPLCVQLQHEEVQGSTDEKGQPKRQVKVFGFANAFGAPYLLFYTIFFTAVYISSQLTAQLVLGLSLFALLCYLEIADGIRDVKELDKAFESGRLSHLVDGNSNEPTTDRRPPPRELTRPRVTFTDIVTISLLGIHTFYATGHQSTISSIQWKSAFVLTANVTYPFSPVTVSLNSLGALLLVGVGASLLGLWNREPKAVPLVNPRARGGVVLAEGRDYSLDIPIRHEGTVSALGVMIYYSALLLGTATSAAILRRHLMVWKVFAPRFMTAALSLIVVDVGAIVGVLLGVERVARRVSELFKGILKG
ncbi:phosphoethanolamine n-methyltransferase [Moniliophthora roreri MCA 2997]|uniref:Phosphoethanolamine n-methyltransferase n=1 Tax=Moniliophthora roreri (strain MCA 2997) TaxID=1381753 RepID=V2X743_MONRO|nr:phosphoethanolamine n-methyltransferase [Moniliophthora roreri MCA 2997]